MADLLGRVTVDSGGRIVEVDDRFCATMRGRREQLVGSNAFDLTALADRERCMVIAEQVLREGRPQVTTKRFIRLDGTHVWVQSAMVPRVESDGTVMLAAEIREASPPDDWIAPGELLRLARLIVASRRGRELVFNRALFADAAWDILLGAYIAEAEGRSISIADIHAGVGISIVNASRWIRALNADGLIEYEGESSSLITSCLRLSTDAHQKFELYLSELYRDTQPRDTILST